MRRPPFDWLEGFEPKFDSLSKDQDRVADLIVSLHDGGKLPTGEGQSLYTLYLVDCSKWLQEAYFDRGLYESIEAVHTGTGEQSIGWPHRGSREVIERFAALGEAGRARRMWRNHLALIKATYRALIEHRDRGLRPTRGMSQEDSRRSFDELVGTIPEQKTLLLEVMAGAREHFARTGASAAELERLDRDIADLEAEKRRPPAGKSDPGAMTEDVFWSVIEGEPEESVAERLQALPERLASVQAERHQAFRSHAARPLGRDLPD